MYKAKIQITFKNGVLDPQGSAVKQALHHLGFVSVKDVRIGRLVEILISSQTPLDAENQIKQMCEQLLANPVIEEYRVLALEEIE